MKYRKKPVVIEATQWHKNGDHPLDYASDTQGLEGGEVRTFTGEERRAKEWEGSIVRYYRNPIGDGNEFCQYCKNVMHIHGWIDTLEGGHIVCPGDWIITGIKGERYPCKPDIFADTYEVVPEGKYGSVEELARAIQEDALLEASEIADQQFLRGLECLTKEALLAELARIQPKP